MDSQVFDNVKFEKAKAIARFNRFRKITKIWQVFEVFVAFAVVSWGSTHVPAVLKMSGEFVFEVSSYLLNHHVVFLIGNVIIVLVVVLCRQNDSGYVSGTGDFYDDYVKHSEAQKCVSSASETEQSPPPVVVAEVAAESGHEEEKQIIVCSESMNVVSQYDDLSMAIEKAEKEINRFQRTQSEKLKREIAVKPRFELRRSETDNCRAIVSSTERQTTMVTLLDAVEIETLSNEEFQRTVDAFIQKHWTKK